VRRLQGYLCSGRRHNEEYVIIARCELSHAPEYHLHQQQLCAGRWRKRGAWAALAAGMQRRKAVLSGVTAHDRERERG